MWTESTMSFGDSLLISVMGISVVFLALIALALAIIVISKLLGSIVKDAPQKPAAAPAPAPVPVVSDEPDKEMLAVLMSTVAEDLGLPTDQFRIKSVTELK